MKRFFQAIMMFLGRLGLPKNVEWQEADALALRAFLNTHAGAKMRQILIGRCAAMNEWAANQATPLACGMAQGTKAMLALLISCAATDSGKSEQSADNNGTADPLAHLRP